VLYDAISELLNISSFSPGVDSTCSWILTLGWFKVTKSQKSIQLNKFWTWQKCCTAWLQKFKCFWTVFCLCVTFFNSNPTIGYQHCGWPALVVFYSLSLSHGGLLTPWLVHDIASLLVLIYAQKCISYYTGSCSIMFVFSWINIVPYLDNIVDIYCCLN